MELELLTGASLSYRKGLKLLNRILHREPESEVKFRTYLDFCQKAGKKAEESAAREAESSLRRHGFDPESGKPRSEEELPPELRKEAKREESPETANLKSFTKDRMKVFAWRTISGVLSASSAYFRQIAGFAHL